MYEGQQVERLPYSTPDILEDHMFQVGFELEKKNQFLHFLQKELNTARTQTEKEAIHSILLKTKLQIRALERELQGIQHSSQTFRSIPQYFHPYLRIRRLQ